MTAVTAILGKVLVIFILIVVGYSISKYGLLTDPGGKDITAILMKLVVPCVIITAFIDSKGSLSVAEMAAATLIALLATLISLGIAQISFRNAAPERRSVLRFSITFSNVGFMGLPLAQGIVGELGVIYASFGVVVFNIFCWTYGYRMMNSQAKLSLRTVLLNPGVIGLALGLPVYFLNLNVPAVIAEPMGMISQLNTPLAMLVIGSYIAKLDFRSFLADKHLYQVSFLRLIVSPTLFLLLMLLVRRVYPIPSALMVTGIIQSAAPSAANCVLFAIQYEKDSILASKIVALTTLISVLTLPLFILIGQGN